MSRHPVYKLVVLGDGGVGKTALTIQMCLNQFVESYDPTIEDSYRKLVVIDEQVAMLEIIDTAGQEEYVTLRDQWIRDGDGFILVYSIDSRNSFTRINTFHQNIMRVKDGFPSFEGSTLPIVIVGNKSDRVTERSVSAQEGLTMAEALRCSFRETSAKTSINVEKPFYDVVRTIRENQRTTSDAHSSQPHGGAHTNVYKAKSGRSKCVIL